MLKKPSLLDPLKTGIQKTRAGLMEKLEDAISGRKEIDADVLEELEYALITADIGARTPPPKFWKAHPSAHRTSVIRWATSLRSRV